MKIELTNRRFRFADFKDFYGENCSIQESSAVVPCIWLGVNANRMHLTIPMVKDLMKLLSYFAVHGELPPPRARRANGNPRMKSLVEDTHKLLTFTSKRRRTNHDS